MTLTYEAAAACYGDMPNPRWIYCHAELGRRPTLVEYIVWLRERQTQFMSQHGDWSSWHDMVTKLGPQIQLRFDAYLQERLHLLRTQARNTRSQAV